VAIVQEAGYAGQRAGSIVKGVYVRSPNAPAVLVIGFDT
jgi:hypothetical protein